MKHLFSHRESQILRCTVLLLAIASLSAACSQASASSLPATETPYRSKMLNVAPGQTQTAEVPARSGWKITGWLALDGQGNDIVFSVQGPDGKEVLAKERHIDRYEFNIDANIDGNYKLIFTNPSRDRRTLMVVQKVAPK